MKKIFLVTLFLAMLAAITIGQSRPYLISRPCPATLSIAKVEIERDGDINLVPCPTSDFLVNGTPSSPTGLSSLNGLIGSAQTFAAPTAADTAAWSSATTIHTLQLPITGVSGSSRTNFFPYFNAANTLAKSPFSWNGTEFLLTNTAADSTFNFAFQPAVSPGTGRLWVGNYPAVNSVYLALDGGNALLGGTGNTSIGDVQGIGNNTKIILDDLGNTIDLNATFVQIGDITGASANSLTFVVDTNNSAFQFINNGVTGPDIIFGNGAGNGIGRFRFARTITAGGTTGNRTINLPAGTVNFAAAATSLTVTNSTVDANSIIIAVTRTNDATCSVKNVVPAAGSFVINMTAGCTAETSVGFLVLN